MGMDSRRLWVALPCVLGLAAWEGPARPAGPYFGIQVVDDRTGRGVPLVELKTVHAVRYFTDSQGYAAIHEPGLEGRKVWFQVSSHGYELPADGFGFRGVSFQLEPGKLGRVRLRRVSPAERLYRITGEGIYRDSALLGKNQPKGALTPRAGVLGCDSVQTAVFGGKLFWLWGDTNRAEYPLGNFHMSGATSLLPGQGGPAPGDGIQLEYFRSKSGFAREMAPIPGEGPTWLDALTVLKEGGSERLLAAYSKIRAPMETYARGICRWDPAQGRFERLRELPVHAPLLPYGHPVIRKTGETEYVYFGDPFPLVRVPATESAFQDLSQYEAYTPLREGNRLTGVTDLALDRDPGGRLRYAWRKNTPAVGPEDQEKLIRAGKLKRDEAQFRLVDPKSGKPVVIHRGTVHWNQYRRRWIMIATEIGGTSFLGEVWYSEAREPEGPWTLARKIATHDRYSFYNPVHHPEFDEQGGRVIYFEGTYTHTFSGNSDQTPRYDYNQIMYRLDLEHPALVTETDSNRRTTRLAPPDLQDP